MKNHLAPKNSHCELCRYNNNEVCSDCVYGTGNNKLKDYYMPTKPVLVERGIVVKRADHYDSIVHDLLSWNGEIKEEVDDIKNYRQY